MTEISSRHNPTVKAIRALRCRRERERVGRFFIEGRHIVYEAVAAGAQVERVVAAPKLLDEEGRERLRALQQERGLPCLAVTPEVFASLSEMEGESGLGAVARQRWVSLDSLRLTDDGPDWIALDSVKYPGNLGTILRTGDAVGCAGAILIDHATDPYDPLAVRASLGAVFSQTLARATFESFAAWKLRTGFPVVGTAPDAPQDYQAVTYPTPCVLYMGSENNGLPPEKQALCDLMVRIPMVGRRDSLNLAMATCLTLYEMFNQKRGARRRPRDTVCAQETVSCLPRAYLSPCKAASMRWLLRPSPKRRGEKVFSHCSPLQGGSAARSPGL